jgi:putative tricarboxylic transport membrane protein
MRNICNTAHRWTGSPETRQPPDLPDQKVWKAENIVPFDVVVHNKAGGGIQLNYIAAHKGDGHYLGISSKSALTAYLTGRTEVGLMQMTPLVQLAKEYISTAVRADSLIRDGKDLITQLRMDPASISIGSAASRGNTNHQGIALPAMKAGIDPNELKVVIFQSGRIGGTNLLGGPVQAAQSSIGGFITLHEQGKLRIIGVTSPERLPGVAKNIPTWKEQGFDVVLYNPRGVFGPPGMTGEQIKYWDSVFAKTVQSPIFKDATSERLMEIAFLAHDDYIRNVVVLDKELREVLKVLGMLKR